MKKTSKTKAKKHSELPSYIASKNDKREGLSQTAGGVTSIKIFPFKSKKKEASKPIYLIRYE